MKTYRLNIPRDRGVTYDYLRFSAGEIDVKIHPDQFDAIAVANIIEVTGDLLNGEVMELLMVVSALGGLAQKYGRKESEVYTKLFLPYLPYGRADRRFVDGGSFGLEAFAHIINGIGFDSVTTFDVHSERAYDFINNLINLSPVEHYNEIGSVIDDIGRDGLALVLPDKGAIVRYPTLEAKFKLPVLIGDKVRDAATGELSHFMAPNGMEKYNKFLIIDDICDAGGTFVGLAKAMRAKAKQYPEIYLYTSHGIYSKGLSELHTYFDEVYKSSFSPFPTQSLRKA